MIDCPFCGSEFVKYEKVSETHYTIERIECSDCKTYSSIKKEVSNKPSINNLETLSPEDFDWFGWTVKDGFIIPKRMAKGVEEVTNEEKLQILNSIPITDIVSFDGYLEIIMVEDNEENRSKLHQLGLTDEEIKDKCFVIEGTLDISEISFEILKAL